MNMRLHLLLRPQREKTAIPFNYAYALSSAIYRWIEESSSEYSSFLHDKGFSIDGTAKKFRHFCFSQLNISKRKIYNGSIIILSLTIDWYISMPVEESVQHLVTGIFERREFFIGDEANRFVVEQVETLPDPPWERTMKFRMLSPVTVSIPEDRNGKFMPRYLQPDDPRLNEALRTNILNKYISLYDHLPSDTRGRG
jgi:CRISPR-associated endoribonuclease Cas6